jgi:hypothetical protein
MDQVDTSANQSKSWYYNHMDDDEVGDGCNGVDEDDAKGSKIQATV